MADTHLDVTSPDLGTAGRIDPRFTCDGSNEIPTLRWSEGPTETRSYAVLVEDPDAPSGVFAHWLVWNIPADVRTLSADNVSRFVQGTNSASEAAWSGPCPPQAGDAHRYFFIVLALDRMLDLEAGADRAALDRAMEGHILARGQLVSLYQRRRGRAAA